MLFCVCWVDKTIVTHNDNSGQALLSPRRIDGAGAFAWVRERRERTNSMHRKSNREAFVATLAVYTYYKVQSLLSLGARQNKLLFARVGRGNASCWESGVFLAKASTVAGQWGQKLWTPHPWCPAVAGSGWQKSSVNEVQIQYKNKNKKPECVCGESSPHSKYNESIHYFSLKSFPIFSACIIAFSFSPSLSRVYFKHLSKAPDDRLFTLQSGVEHPQMHQPLKSSGEERRGEGERERP